MRDINFTSRDLHGNVSYSWKSTANSGIEVILQKIVVSAFSKTLTTYFNQINGLDIESSSKYNFGSVGLNNFKMQITSDLINLQTQLIKEDTINNTPNADRLKSLVLKDIIFDTFTKNISIILVVSTNSSSQIITLPVK